MKELVLAFFAITLTGALAARAADVQVPEKQPAAETLTEAEKTLIAKEVEDQFGKLAAAVNQMNAGAWSDFYSNDGFISAIAGTESYTAKSAWVAAITGYFATRESQLLEPLQVRVAALAPRLALMTSEEKSVMRMKDGKRVNFRHVYTMLWRKEQSGWKILHSHESWMNEPAK